MERSALLIAACEGASVAALYLFGSRADDGLAVLAGRPAPPSGSDLDVGVLFEPGAGTPRARVRLAVALEDVFSPLRVDLVPLDTVDALFRFRAIDGHRVFVRDGRRADRYELVTMRQAAELLPLQRAIERDRFGSSTS